MAKEPITAIPRQGNWRRDSSGMLMPTGSGSSARELMQLPKEMRDIAFGANTIIRGNFTDEIWPIISSLLAIAPRHYRTLHTISAITAGSMARNGQATTNTLQAMVNMLVPGALSPYQTQMMPRKKDSKLRRDHEDKVSADDE